MKFGAIGVFGIAILLCGCSDADWDNALTYNHQESSDTAAGQTASANAPTPVESASLPAPQAEPMSPQPAPPQMADSMAATQPSYTVTQTVATVAPVRPMNPAVGYCRKVAQSSGAVATTDGEDDQAQQNAADAAYQECLHFYGASDR